MRGNIFHIEQIRRPEGLLRGHQQIMLAAKVVAQRGIEDDAPEDVPLTRFIVGEGVDHQVVIVFRIAGRMVLLARHHDIEIEALIQRLTLEQTFAKCPRTQRGCLMDAPWYLWYKLGACTFVIGRERFGVRDWSSKSHRCRQNP